MNFLNKVKDKLGIKKSPPIPSEGLLSPKMIDTLEKFKILFNKIEPYFNWFVKTYPELKEDFSNILFALQGKNKMTHIFRQIPF